MKPLEEYSGEFALGFGLEIETACYRSLVSLHC